MPPFDKPITITKATAIYNIHSYWSKKLHDAIQQYIRHCTLPSDLVLDPFCGSGEQPRWKKVIRYVSGEARKRLSQRKIRISNPDSKTKDLTEYYEHNI